MRPPESRFRLNVNLRMEPVKQALDGDRYSIHHVTYTVAVALTSVEVMRS